MIRKILKLSSSIAILFLFIIIINHFNDNLLQGVIAQQPTTPTSYFDNCAGSRKMILTIQEGSESPDILTLVPLTSTPGYPEQGTIQGGASIITPNVGRYDFVSTTLGSIAVGLNSGHTDQIDVTGNVEGGILSLTGAVQRSEISITTPITISRDGERGFQITIEKNGVPVIVKVKIKCKDGYLS